MNNQKNLKKVRFGFNGMSFMTLIIAVVLFSLAALPVSAQTELEGSWTSPYPVANNATWTFSGNRFTYEQDDVALYEGTFTTKNKSITLKHSNGGEVTAAYTINNFLFDMKEPKLKNWPKGASFRNGWFFNKEAILAQPPDSTPTVFEGTWKHPNPQSENATFTFSGNSFTYTQGTQSVTGRIIFDKKDITLITEDGSFILPHIWRTPYTVSKTKLELKQDNGLWFGWYGVFNKQN